jgi:hypothetical protein
MLFAHLSSIPCAKSALDENQPLVNRAPWRRVENIAASNQMLRSKAAARTTDRVGCRYATGEMIMPLRSPHVALNVGAGQCFQGVASDGFSRNRNVAVSRRWQARQSVRRLLRSHSPPPSTTGTMWSASHRLRRLRRRSPQRLSSRRRCPPRERFRSAYADVVSVPHDAQMPRSRSQT